MSDNSHSTAALSLAALGIVYGDIGTSPLYAFKVAATAIADGATPSSIQILSILSIIIWSLILIVSVKYMTFVMKADNHEEGGILALLALIKPPKAGIIHTGFLFTIGLFGAALLYGDGVITPAISVMSAVEGLDVITTSLSSYVKPITLGILVALFMFQYKGTTNIGKLFGPIMAIWFAAIAMLGLYSVIQHPGVLVALNPIYALNIFTGHPLVTFMVIGAVFLAVTGAEACYADMGHVGRTPIRIAWNMIVLPSLILNYMGQAALIINDPKEIENPFYHLASGWMLIPLVILATAATVIASQALISGVFSITRQAGNMGLLPRIKYFQTSSVGYGQIYVPIINYWLLSMVMIVVIIFKTSDDLAAAYGVAVSATMLITTVLLYFAMRRVWNWNFFPSLLITSIFFIIDTTFLGSNLMKLMDGGWLPLAAGTLLFYIMVIWGKGTVLVNKRLQSLSGKLKDFVEMTASFPRMEGVGVFLTKNIENIPSELIHHVRHNKILPETLIIMNLTVAEIPRVHARDRLTLQDLGNGIWRVRAVYGFMQTPNAPVTIRALEKLKVISNPDEVTYFVGNVKVVGNDECYDLQCFEQFMFTFMSHNACSAIDFFKLPEDQVVEVGIRVEV